MSKPSVADRLRVEVKHRRPAARRYTWELYSENRILPVDESIDQFRSWEEAYQSGKKAMSALLAEKHGAD